MRSRFAAAVGALFLTTYSIVNWSHAAVVEEEKKDNMPEKTFRLVLENDVFFSEDNNYTNGIRLDYTHRLSTGDYWAFTLRQDIYTPYTNNSYVHPGEHPYAGYLALGTGYIMTGESFGLNVELQLGVTGDLSLAEDSQRVIHGIGQLFQWQGWEHQVPAEFTMQLSSSQEIDLAFMEWEGDSGWQSDGMLFVQEELGTVSMRAGMGITMRVGINLPPYQRRVGNYNASFGLSSLIKPDFDPEKLSLFFLANVSGYYVARDFSLDGGVFRYFEHDVNRTPWQMEVQVGVGGQYDKVDFFFGATIQSERFDRQGGSEVHGVLSVGWAW